MKVFLIRHGETALNAAGVLRGQLDVPLNLVGEAQARALGEVFGGSALRAVVSSPLSRAVDTARPVATASGAPLSVDERLSDRFYGGLAGQSIEQAEERFGSVDAAPSVEPRQLVAARAEEAFHDAVLVAAAAGDSAGAVALVSHDAVIRALLGNLVPALAAVELSLPTGSWSELREEAGETRWRAVHIGEVPAGGARP